MSTVAKILVVLNLVLAAAFLASAASYLGNQDHWSKKHSDLQKKMDTTVAEKDAKIKEQTEQQSRLIRQVSDAEQAKVAAEQQASKDRAQNDLLREAQKQSSATAASATRSLEAAQETIQSNQVLIGQLQEQRQKATEGIQVANDAKDAAVRQLNQLQVANENLAREKDSLLAQGDEQQKKIQALEFEVAALRRGGGGSDVPTDQPASISGRVLAVDEATNVVVISLGDEDKVKPGFKYIVARGDQYVATLEVTNVEAKKSAARSQRDVQKSVPKVGDTVIPR